MKLHAMRLPGVAPDLGDERGLILGTRLEPTFALQHSVHDFSPRT
jgi:hypothetical protein